MKALSWLAYSLGSLIAIAAVAGQTPYPVKFTALGICLVIIGYLLRFENVESEELKNGSCYRLMLLNDNAFFNGIYIRALGGFNTTRGFLHKSQVQVVKQLI